MKGKFLDKQVKEKKHLFINKLPFDFFLFKLCDLYLKFRSKLLIVIQIIKEKSKHGHHWLEKPVKDPTLNPDKILQKGSLIKNLGTHICKPWTLNFWNNDLCSNPINEVICRKPPWRAKNQYIFKTKWLRT